MSAGRTRIRLSPHSAAAKLGCAVLAVAALLVSDAGAETVQKGSLRVSFAGKVSPKALPRHGDAPIAVTVGGTIATTDGAPPPQLREIEIAINPVGRFDTEGLPSCTYADVQPSTTAAARAACGPAKVGEGSFAANVALPEQSPFPSQGKIVAFNGVEKGRPVILAHVYGTVPVPLSYTLVLRMTPGKGTWGTVLSASLPAVTSDVAYITGISLTLNRRFSVGGKTHGYVSAGCSASVGFPGASFPLARASFSFAGAGTLSSTLQRSCRAKD
jgi:hypothetical protein